MGTHLKVLFACLGSNRAYGGTLDRLAVGRVGIASLAILPDIFLQLGNLGHSQIMRVRIYERAAERI